MRTIAVVNQKGGVGKTTVSINLASALAEMEHKTLLVDMDSQSHCAVGLAVPEEQIEQSIYDVMISHSKEEPMRLGEILWEVSEKLELAPASIDLSAFEQQMSGMPDRELCLKKVLDSIKNEYEFVVIDCPPSVGLLTFNALRAATDVIVPVETGYFALHGLSKQLETLAILCQRCNQAVNVKVLASMYDIRTKMAREILGELRKHFGDKMFKTVVNFNTKLKEAASFGQPISEYDPASKGHKDFQDLVKEMMQGQPEQQRRQIIESLSEKLESISATADELLARAKPKVAPPDAGRIKSIEPPKQRPQYMEPVAVRAEPKQAEAKAVAIARVEAKPVVAVQPQQPKAAEIAKVEAKSVVAVQPQQPKAAAATDAKLAEYYGVNQLNDAMAFVTLYPRAQSVQIAGDFNGWQPSKLPMEKVGESGVWQASAKLPPGRYRYRLVVDGQWQQDPYNDTTELNPFGGYNSIVEVK
jgi:chromosome partitioning protein